MTGVSDSELLAQFVRDHSGAAFALLVERHLALVHSVALRHTADDQHAQDISQAVFIILARKAGTLGRKTVLAGWLYHTARLTAANLQRREMRRMHREQEAFMQSTLNEYDLSRQIGTEAEVWRELSPQLDEAMARLGHADRDALVLRYFQNKSLTEVAAALGVAERAAQKRVSRALEKLRKLFGKRGIALSAAAIAGAVSANSVQAAPAALANTITAVAVTKGAAVGTSTLTLIKGALKIMAWTKAKTAVAAGAMVLFVAGTTTITVREIQEHRTYPWQVHEGLISEEQINQPPQVRILPSKFQAPDWATVNGKMIGTGVQAQNVVAAAYGYITPARVAFSARLPAGRYDYIACLAGGEDANELALQAEVKCKFGVAGTVSMRNADVWLLRVKYPNAAALKRNTKSGNKGNGFSPSPAGFHGWNERMFDLAYELEFLANVPVTDATDIPDRFDFDLNCTERNLKDHDWETVNLALGKLGLELVPTNMPIQMLLVEKVK